MMFSTAIFGSDFCVLSPVIQTKRTQAKYWESLRLCHLIAGSTFDWLYFRFWWAILRLLPSVICAALPVAYPGVLVLGEINQLFGLDHCCISVNYRS